MRRNRRMEYISQVGVLVFIDVCNITTKKRNIRRGNSLEQPLVFSMIIDGKRN